MSESPIAFDVKARECPMAIEVPGEDERLTILHVSDAHFGCPDPRNEMPRILGKLIIAAHQQEWTPDVCVFSGDLAHSGAKEDFEKGLQWLELLIQKWPNTRLLVVPGNHDVDRDRANLVLRQAFVDESTFTQLRSRLAANQHHLQHFVSFHAEAKRRLSDRLISDWSDSFGFVHLFEHQRRPIRLIGINTAITSCANDDKGKLIADVGTLNRLLGQRNDENECVVVVGHHPLLWLTEWNRQETDRLLKQKSGAHLYLHGHQHEQAAASLSSSQGEKLAILECGAAYQSQKWPNYFSSYRLLFRKSIIEAAVFALSPSSGDWIYQPDRSGTFLAELPGSTLSDLRRSKAGAAAPSASMKEGALNKAKEVTLLSPSKRSDFNKEASAAPVPYNDDAIELDARRRLQEAEEVFTYVKSLLTDDFLRQLPMPLYRSESRKKELATICSKVKGKRQKGDSAYSVKNVEDICGFRIVSVFQADIPSIMHRILSRLTDGPSTGFQKNLRIVVHTSRPENDPLSIRPLITRFVEEWPEPCAVEFINRSTGYSSVHVVLDCALPKAKGSSLIMPVEFQFRSGLEEFWGQLDHKLRYYTNRGDVGQISWQQHLNVLKTQIDAAIQYIDLIKRLAETRSNEPGVVVQKSAPESTLSISTPEGQLASLRDLPPQIYQQLETAFALWKEADASRQFGGNPSKFREAADAFIPLVDGCPSAVEDERLSSRLAHMAKVERAYMLTGTNDRESFEIARNIYEEILRRNETDGTALLRMGQVLMEYKRFKEATRYLNKAMDVTKEAAAQQPNGEAARIYDYAQMNKALIQFRIFEDRALERDARNESLKLAIQSARDVIETGRDAEQRRRALNDYMYYLWEERANAGLPANDLSADDAEYREYAARLFGEFGDEAETLSYRIYDTECRVACSLSLWGAAGKFANLVLRMLEQAARERGGNIPSGRLTIAWAAAIVAKLKDVDEQDAFLFASGVLEKLSEPNGEPTGKAANGVGTS